VRDGGDGELWHGEWRQHDQRAVDLGAVSFWQSQRY
jgi:hypothetical protein